VGAVGVVVIDVDLKHVFEMAATTDQDPVQTLTPHGADETLVVGVGFRREYRGADHPYAFAAERLVEGTAELRIPVSDEVRPNAQLLAQSHEEVAGLFVAN